VEGLLLRHLSLSQGFQSERLQVLSVAFLRTTSVGLGRNELGQTVEVLALACLVDFLSLSSHPLSLVVKLPVAYARGVALGGRARTV